MNIIIKILLAAVLSFSSCSGSRDEPANNSYPIRIIPSNRVDQEPDISVNNNTGSENKSSDKILVKADLDDNYNILYIKNINLDFDIEDEQVIVVNTQDDKTNIKIYVVDFDSVRNRYDITWEAEKKDINQRSISVSYIDIVGDHNLEIIFTASSASGSSQVFDIFRKTHSPSGIRLYYESICDLILDGQIEIIEKERSMAYTLGQKNGISFPVETYETIDSGDPSKVSDILKTSYIWNYQANRYLKGFEETIPGKKIEEEKLRRLFFDGVEAYKSFLHGQWYNVESPGYIIRFDNSAGDITFFTRDSLETYQWSDFSYSRVWNRIDINARNSLIHFITKRITIQIESMNRINIEVRDVENIKDIDQMNGVYERISEELIAQTIYDTSDITPPTEVNLSGEFSGRNDSITFNGKSFIQKSETEVKKGFFTLYDYNSEMILELRYINENKLVTDIKQYKIEYEKSETDSNRTNKITLVNGLLNPYNFSSYGEDPLIYMQTLEITAN